MSTRKSVSRTSVSFDFSAVGSTVTIPPKPADGLSQDKVDAIKRARTEAYRAKDALRLDALEAAIQNHVGDADALVRLVFTFVAQCTKANYTLADVARETGKCDPSAVQPRDNARVDAAMKTLGITPEMLEVIKRMSAGK